MKKMKKFEMGIGIIVFIIPILIAVYFGFQKQGYFVDEVWSYGLANSKDYAHLYSPNGWDADWIQPSYFEHYIEVEPGEQFSYGSVFRNQMDDNHPPFFYLVLHTVSSFFPGKFSKWFGIVPNLFYLLITNIFLYKILKRFTDNKGIAIAGMLIYALSAGAISCTIYIRMYMMLTMWMMILLYIYMDIYENEKVQRRDLIACSLVTFSGCMTQYYFYIALFFSAGMLCFLLLLRKRWRDMIEFIVANIASMLMVLIVFPLSFIKILGKDGDRGVQAYNAFGEHQDVFGKFKQFYMIINQQLYNNLLSAILLLGLVGIAAVIVYYMIQRKIPESVWKDAFILVPITVTVGYMMIMAFVAPYQTDRYIYIIYPVSILCIVFIFDKIFQTFNVPVRYLTGILLLITLIFSYREIKSDQICYLYPDSLHNMEFAEQYSNDDCIYVTDQWYLITADVPELMKYNRVLRISYDGLREVKNRLEPDTKELIVYVDNMLGGSTEDRGNEIAEDIAMNQWEYLYSSDKCWVYRVYK